MNTGWYSCKNTAI